MAMYCHLSLSRLWHPTPILCTLSHVYTQPCSPWTRPDQSTPGPFHPLSSPSRALCSICDTYVSTHDAMLLSSDSREHRWPIVNTHDQLQITELAPKLARVSTTPRTCIRCHAPNWFSAVNMDKDSRRTLWHYCDEWVQNNTHSFSAPGFTKAEEESR